MSQGVSIYGEKVPSSWCDRQCEAGDSERQVGPGGLTQEASAWPAGCSELRPLSPSLSAEPLCPQEQGRASSDCPRPLLQGAPSGALAPQPHPTGRVSPQRRGRTRELGASPQAVLCAQARPPLEATRSSSALHCPI